MSATSTRVHVPSENTSCKPKDWLEETLTNLHQSMEQARSTGEDSLPDGENCSSTTSSNNSSWLLGMFHKMEKKHAAEKSIWIKDLDTERKKKSTYKSQLKDAYRDRIQWLEGKLKEAEDPNCCQTGQDSEANQEDPTGDIFPSISRNSTATTQGSSTTGVEQLILSPKQGQEGYEITFQTNKSTQRVQRLEGTLQDTVQQHEKERAEWVKTIEDAALAMDTGKQLSVQHEEELKELQRQVARHNYSDKKKWKQKNQILQELLDLTEQLQSSERKEWQEEIKVFEITVSKLSSDKVALQAHAEKMEKELSEMQARLNELSVAQGEWNHENVEPEAKERSDEVQKQYLAMLEAKDKEIEEEKQQFESQRKKWMETYESSQKTWELETQLQVQELQDKHAEELRALNMPDSALQARYRESVEKNNDLVKRLRTMERQRSAEKGEWKLKLESALAQSRKFAAAAQEMEDQLKDLHSRENVSLQNRVSGLSDIQSLTSSEENRKLQIQLEAERQEAECKFAALRESHAREMQHLASERESHAMEIEHLATELETLRDENETIKIELNTLKDSGARLQAENRYQAESSKRDAENLAELEEKHTRESQEWASRLKVSEAEADALVDRIKKLESSLEEALELSDRHAMEAQECAVRLEESNLELIALRQKTNEMENLLQDAAELKEKNFSELSHWKNLAKKWEEDVKHVNSELDHCRSELDSYTLDRDGAVDTFSKETLADHKNVICSSIEELRKDVVAVRETMESSSKTDKIVDNLNYDALRGDLDQLQTGLTDVVAELTLETEAMYETRNAVQVLTNGTVPHGREDMSSVLEQQEKLFSQLGELNDSLRGLLQSDSKLDSGRDAIRLELVAELQRKQSSLTQLDEQLEATEDQLKEEVTMREKAQADIISLMDQADAYTEEIMHLQAENARLDATLKAAERKMVSVLTSRFGPEDPESLGSSVSRRQASTENDDDSSPLLDGALALAKSLSEIVQGHNDEGNETSVMDMLESLSEMMDQHDRGELPGQSRSQEYDDPDVGAESGIEVAQEYLGAEDLRHESPPTPIKSPQGSKIMSFGERPVQALVEHLYSRCQLLERERLEMMEVTLDLLESARKATKAELDVALATARRKSAEEMIRVREHNSVERERLYHRLCSHCVGLLSDTPQSGR